MKDAVGGSLLLNIVVFFLSVVILFFVGIVAYSKAYKIKNRIIEVIEKYDGYNDFVKKEINSDLIRSGYIISTQNEVSDKCGKFGNGNLNDTEYLYCVYEKESLSGSRTYKVVTFTRFEFPVIGDLVMIPVKGETKDVGKNYDY